MQKILVILGPTASGKTKLAVKLAKKFNGEIVSADSRQVYRGMDIGTGKDLKEYKNIPYHLIDVADPKNKFSLAKYQKLTYFAIDNILAQNKLPIICGGSGLYLQAIVDGFNLSSAKPDLKLRKNLEKQNIQELFLEIKKINPKFASKINESDQKNKRRLIRYLEILNSPKIKKPQKIYNTLIIGLNPPKEILQEKIKARLIQRLEQEGMIEEVRDLHDQQKISWKRLESFGLEYKYLALYLQKKISRKEMEEKLLIAIRQFAKKQMSWFRRWEKQGANINWLDNYAKISETLKYFSQ